MAETKQISLPMEATRRDALPMEDTLQTQQGVQPKGTVPMGATEHKEPGRQRKGRRKIPMQRIVSDEDRLITFSKRRAGIYKKATEIGTLCGADVGVLIFSPAGKPFAYGVPNIESIADRFLRGRNPSQNENVSNIAVEAQRMAHVGKLNRECDELSVYLQNLKKEGVKLMEMKKQAFDDDCWWDVPVEDLKANEIEKMTMAMEEIKKNASKRLRDLKMGASSSVIQPKVVQMSRDGGFGYGSAGGYGNFTAGGSSTMVEGVQGGVSQMDGKLGQGYSEDAGSGGGGPGDWKDGASTVAVEGIQGGGGFRVDGNGGLSGNYGGLGDWGVDGAFSLVQAGAMQMDAKGGDGYGRGVAGSFGDFKTGVPSSLATIQHGGVQIGENGGAGFGGGDVSSGGIGEWKSILSSVTSSSIQPGGSMQVVGNGSGGYGGGGPSGGYGGGVASGGGLGGGWREIASSSTSSAIMGATPVQMDGNGGFSSFGGSAGAVSGGGRGGWREYGPLSMHMGGNGGFGYNGYVGASGGLGGASLSSSLQPDPMQMGGNGGLGYGGIGGGFGNFAMGGSSSSAPKPEQMQMGGTSNGGSFNDAGVGFGNNNGFGGFMNNGRGGF